ncbi:MAG: excinuclease ABC subunit UvrC [Chloroflexi bacterium]|nr:excinuclease ABC subunit UvrC [Chloroflexota bacterium]
MPVDFSERLKITPTKPGIYQMRDQAQNVLYVGKASNLRNRIRSYFGNSTDLTPKITAMVSKVADFEYIVTESEQEAIILECNLIKRHKPPYNARLKDDKSYPFIKIDLTENFPEVYLTRRVQDDGAKYFGPFASASSVRQTLDLLKKLFPYRSCTKTITGKDVRPCLDYFINRCVGPCIGAVNQEEYRAVIDQVILFMEGKTEKVVKGLKNKMLVASENLEFEKAAALRDQIQAIERVNEGQKVLSLAKENQDVFALSQGRNEAWVEVFFIRQGKLIGRDNFIMDGTQDEMSRKVLTAFVEQFYTSAPYVPPQILLQHPLEDSDVVRQWLEKKRGGKVSLLVPMRGEKKDLVKMVAENALQGLEQLKAKWMADTDNLEAAMAEVQEALNLPRLPVRMECYDISNIQGTNPVGSMVVFENGKPKTSHYRRFKIKNVDGVDDYSMMREMLTRRFRKMGASANGNEASASGDKHSTDESYGTVPDLVIIDGGKGHLGAALQVFLELGVNNVPLASLAKENEELFVPHTPEPIILPRSSQGLFLVQRIRDEAHRFAITFHRSLRSKSEVTSAMDIIPGIGPKRKRLLVRRFGSIKAIKDASLEEIASVPGMTLKLAQKVKEYL